MPTAAAARYAQPGRSTDATTGLSGIEPKIAAFVPSRTSPGLNRMIARARSWLVWAGDDRDDDRRDDEDRDDRRGGVRATRRPGRDERRDPAEQAGHEHAWSRNRGTAAISSASPVAGSGATKTRPTNRMRYGATVDREERDHQPEDLGQRVVGAGQDPREVERQDAVALVAPEQLGRLGGAEQHDQDADEAVVGLVADRRGLLEASPPGPACAASAANPTASTAGRIASPASVNGAILARPPRPIPKHARIVWVNSARTALRRPSRGPA